MSRGAVALTILWTFAAAAQVVPERELEIVRQNFDVGNYKDALTRARNAMEVSNFNEAQRVELHKFAGLSAFNLGDNAAAEKHFFALLQLNPDYVLDPFAYPPPAIRLFEDVKKKNENGLGLIRQQIALREEQMRRESAERERINALAELERRRLEQLARQTTITTIEKRSFLVNFIPFGAGQFQQGRTGIAVLFASIEAVLGLTSLVSYFVIERMFEPITYTWTDRIYPFSITVRRIPEGLKSSAFNWKVVKYTSGGLFYGAWAAGVIEALLHHEDEIVTTESRRIESGPAAPEPVKPEVPKVFLFPTSGGLGAGVSLRF